MRPPGGTNEPARGYAGGYAWQRMRPPGEPPGELVPVSGCVPVSGLRYVEHCEMMLPGLPITFKKSTAPVARIRCGVVVWCGAVWRGVVVWCGSWYRAAAFCELGAEMECGRWVGGFL